MGSRKEEDHRERREMTCTTYDKYLSIRIAILAEKQIARENQLNQIYFQIVFLTLEASLWKSRKRFGLTRDDLRQFLVAEVSHIKYCSIALR